jgi:hypothetical protein
MTRSKKMQLWSTRNRVPHRRRSALRLESLERRELMAGDFLQGIAFNDANSNGQYDAGDTPLSGAQISLQKPSDGSFVPQSMVTGPDGIYRFTDLAAGAYRLVETPPVGHVNSATQTNLSQLSPVTGSTSNSIDVTIGNSDAATWTVSVPFRNKDGVLFHGAGANRSQLVGQFIANVTETDIGYNTGNFSTYCIDLLRGLSTGDTGLPYNTAPLDEGIALPAGAAGKMAYLYNHYGTLAMGAPLPAGLGLGPTMTIDNAAGLQLALWQLAYGDVSVQLVQQVGGNQLPDPSSGSQAVVEAAYAAFVNDAAGKSELAVYLNGLPTGARPDGSQAIIATGSLNFANVQTASLGDFVWGDVNMNGRQDAGEAGIDGVPVTLAGAGSDGAFGTADDTTKVTTTALGGKYDFTGLAPGNYQVTFELPAAYFITLADATAPNDNIDSDAQATDELPNIGVTNVITLAAGEINNSVDAGAILGVPDGGSLLVNIVKLTNGTDNNVAPGPSVPAGSTVTWTYIVSSAVALSNVEVVDDNGTPLDTADDFHFPTIASIPAGGSVTLTRTGIAQVGQYKNVATVTGTDAVFGNTVSGTDVDHYFGVAPPATGSLSGFVYKDANNNGVKDSGETGLSGVVVKLTGTDAQGNPVNATQTTDLDGLYSFIGLAAGTYQITEVQPGDYLDGRDALGSLGGVLSDDLISAIALPAAASGTNYNFGELGKSKLSGYVYLDKDNDGRRETGEYGVQGVKITLIGLTDECLVYYTAYTNSSGYYEFNNLRPGIYAIAESDPSYLADGKDTLGTINGVTSGWVCNDIFFVYLTESDVGLNYNFGERKY